MICAHILWHLIYGHLSNEVNENGHRLWQIMCYRSECRMFNLQFTFSNQHILYVKFHQLLFHSPQFIYFIKMHFSSMQWFLIAFCADGNSNLRVASTILSNSCAIYILCKILCPLFYSIIRRLIMRSRRLWSFTEINKLQSSSRSRRSCIVSLHNTAKTL